MTYPSIIVLRGSGVRIILLSRLPTYTPAHVTPYEQVVHWPSCNRPRAADYARTDLLDPARRGRMRGRDRVHFHVHGTISDGRSKSRT